MTHIIYQSIHTSITKLEKRKQKSVEIAEKRRKEETKAKQNKEDMKVVCGGILSVSVNNLVIALFVS